MLSPPLFRTVLPALVVLTVGVCVHVWLAPSRVTIVPIPSPHIVVHERGCETPQQPTGLAHTARILPSLRNGQLEGIKLYGIRRDSSLAAIGLHNGDMITHIDDEPIDSPARAIAPRDASTLSITLVRHGETITKRFEIR